MVGRIFTGGQNPLRRHLRQGDYILMPSNIARQSNHIKEKVVKPERNPKEKAFYECIRPHVENVVANEFGIVFENLLAPGDLYDHIIEQIMHDLW